MCLIWGATWIAMKVGVEAVPPILFVGTRFVAAGALLAGYVLWTGERWPFERRDLYRLPLVTLLMVCAAYALIFWGAVHVSSGLAAVIDLSFLPVALLALAVLLREERFDGHRAAAIGLGILGLAVLFAPKVAGQVSGTVMELWGGLAIVASAVVYGLGSVLARPLLRRSSPILLSAATLLPGGAILVVASLLFEPGAVAALDGRWGWAAWSGWAFLVLFGSLLAYTFYLGLVRDWGPTRAGTYCFISPGIAVILGIAVLGEELRPTDVVGMAVMLVAAWLALRSRAAAPHPTGSSSTSEGAGYDTASSLHPHGGPRWSTTRDV
jgi:drug/metabolite transporter (DMT)-like permease